MDIMLFLKPELAILVPVLNGIGYGLKLSSQKEAARICGKDIPRYLMGIGVVLALLWTLGTADMEGLRDVGAASINAIFQGILYGSAAVGMHQNIKQKSQEGE